ncbi:CD1375 family protein [Alkalicoccus chagannorensis]|nr:CD1375 family protein [Alkalicoccus chagannorensis]
MATIYTTLIVREAKTYDEVPNVLKEEVADELRALGLEKLITE